MARTFTTHTTHGATLNIVANSPAEYAAYMVAHLNGSRREASDWNGHCSTAAALAACNHGDNALVARSDAALAALESSLDMPTPRAITRLDVAGGIPCVPAHLAGAPMAMRRRVRVQDEAAPLGVIIETTSSGAISAEKMLERGAAILALVRLLCARRPVECWAVSGLGGRDGEHGAVFQWARIETAPLDLATAAFALGHIGFARSLCYSHKATGSGWPFAGRTRSASGMAPIIAAALPHLGESMFVPPPYGHGDEAISNPTQWVRDHLARYAPDSE